MDIDQYNELERLRETSMGCNTAYMWDQNDDSERNCCICLSKSLSRESGLPVSEYNGNKLVYIRKWVMRCNLNKIQVFNSENKYEEQ